MEIIAKKGEYLDILLRSKKTVFTTKDIALIWRSPSLGAARVRLNYYVKNGKLLHLRKGIYAKDKNYDKLELATSIFRPSYVSFETVLGRVGMTFQFYGQIFVASYLTREIECNGQKYAFRTIKKNVLINPGGIDQSGEYSIATKERAFLDTVYRSQEYHFDNLSPLDWEKVFVILPIYENKKMAQRVKLYYKHFQNSQ